MRYRPLGRTGLNISEIGFGCGNTAGLMTQGSVEDERAAVQRAVELGVNYFDTAPNYGARVGGTGVSERHLGQVLRDLSIDPIVGSKVEFSPDELSDISGTILRSVEESLSRLGRDSLDILYLHNRFAYERSLREGSIGSQLSVEDVLGPGGVAETFELLRDRGSVRFLAFCSTGGDPLAVQDVIASGRFDVVQLIYNILDPTEGGAPPRGYRGPDHGDTIKQAAAEGMGVVVIRVLSGGALSGNPERHPLNEGSRAGSADYAAQAAQAQSLRFLTPDGQQTLAQAAVRFALANPGVSTTLVGFSAVEQVEEAARASELGGLPPEDLAKIEAWYATQGD